ncbi:MAG: phage tail tape measure protein, partial [Oscillospiraceae bacterium]|nr:phage tail tape measure protein [Oscillospiraceae bacterium]
MKQKWQIALEAKDKITPLLSTLKNGLSTVAGKAWSVTLKAIDLVTSPVKGILNLLKNPILQAGAVLGVTIGLTDTINTYKDFEATMSKVKAISGATTSEMERLTAKAKEMGETTKFTATEAGD